MILEVTLKVLIQNSQKKYLVLERAKPYPKENFVRWDTPGGRLEIGESLENALKREIYEETHLEVQKIKQIILAQDIFRVKEKHTIRITYLVTCNKGIIILNPLEHSQYKWVSLGELKKLKHDKYLTQVLKLLSNS